MPIFHSADARRRRCPTGDGADGSPAAGPEPARAARSWVPIRSLGAAPSRAHRRRTCSRSTSTRATCASATPRPTRRSIATSTCSTSSSDEVFGIFNRRLELIALAHLAHRDADPARGRAAMSEFGVSVLPQARRRGFGRRLFEHAMLHARNRGVRHDLHPCAEREHGDAQARAERRRDRRARRLGIRGLARAAARFLRLAPRRAGRRARRRVSTTG